MRRQARDLLDEIPAAELPSALAFLTFLRDRGTSPLLSPDERPRADAVTADPEPPSPRAVAETG